MALRLFNSVAGITVGNDPQTTVILANGDITTTNLTANGISNLGIIGNVKITGGNTYQVIATLDDTGAGNLGWATLTFMEAAGANTEVQYNNNNVLGASPSFTFDSANTLLTANNFVATSTANLGNIGNVKITGGTSGYIISTDGSGNLNFVSPTETQSPAPMPTYVATGDTLTISANYQGLFGYPITVDGDIVVDGVLIDVNAATIPGGNINAVQFNNGVQLTGTSTFTFVDSTGVLSVPNITTTGVVKTTATTYSGLPLAGTAGAGARAFITDANTTTFLATVIGGGSNAVPVVSNGSTWIVG